MVARCGVARCCADASRQMSEIQQTVAAQPVVVYSKSWCPFCTECKELLDSMEQPYTVVELDQRDAGDAVQAALLSHTRQRTVPNVIVGGRWETGIIATSAVAAFGALLMLVGSDGPFPFKGVSHFQCALVGKCLVSTASWKRDFSLVGWVFIPAL